MNVLFNWLAENASHYTNIITFLGVAGAAATWAYKVLIQSKKNVESLITSIADIKRQLVANGGHSLFDIVKDTRTKIEGLTYDLQKVKAWQWSFSQASNMPIWESNAKGACIRVNIAMSELTGRDSDQMGGTGWENIMPPGPERAEVWNSWSDAVERAREFEHTYTVIHAITKKRSRVRAAATPIVVEGKLVGFLGRFEEVVPEA